MKVKVINLLTKKIIEMDSISYFSKVKLWNNRHEYSLMLSKEEVIKLKEIHPEHIEELIKYENILNSKHNIKNDNEFSIEELHGRDKIGALGEGAEIEEQIEEAQIQTVKKRGRKPKYSNL